MQQPNILFIQVDQLTAFSLRCYGDTACHAPNIDQLADSGTVFETAYCNFPLCAPSRFSMATGQLCSTIGAYDNAAEMPASLPTYAHYLRAAGYQTALSGKMHFIGPDQHHGFEARLTPDLYPADFSWVPNWENEGKRDTNDARAVLVSGVCERSVQIDFDEMVTTQAIQHLYDIARSKDDRPFFLQVSYTHPHEPYLCRKEYWDLYEGVEIPLPNVPALSSNEHDAHSRRLLADFSMLDMRFADEDIARARRAYYGSISYLDAMVGRVLETLDAIGQAENTAIIFTSDHGEMLGERGMWFKKHFFEPALRVPLIMKLPGEGQGRVDTPVSLVDLLPTFMGIAKGSNWCNWVEALEGCSLVPMIGQPPKHDRPIYAEYLAETTPSPILMIRQGQYKFVYSKEDPALLFDLETDENERYNLATDPNHSERVATFTKQILAKWNIDTLATNIVASQKRRRLIVDGYAYGQRPRWNHDEQVGEEVLWYRGEGGYNEWAFEFLPTKMDTV
ncbi:choline-sulfatase [Pelagibius litoralis]|uniref:Choline-sulfatase n=1 Tax=Pelagibius litoralis TaxID=374515 RepID=A0A967KGH1_9PROT|nr:choline-sulfatase [Pelagibius litoralis]NIA70351.1 choline-sulfatase [Pelagibius litoralis]